MCYDISYMTKRAKKYAEHYRIDESVISREQEAHLPVFHVQAFAHPDIPVITDEFPDRIQFYQWGLIPFWVKDAAGAAKISKRTINARGEEMFEKPSFRQSARKKRCLVVVDGFYEHHWKDGKSYPFFIRLKNDEPFSLAGLWDCWHSKSEDITRYSVSIVTTSANSLLSKIHNNPKASHEPRMPVVLPQELESEWLIAANDPVDISKIKTLVSPYPDGELVAHPVDRLRGKAYKGNISATRDAMDYDELRDHFWR